jgi:hypothetical protein
MRNISRRAVVVTPYNCIVNFFPFAAVRDARPYGSWGILIKYIFWAAIVGDVTLDVPSIGTRF